MRKYAVITGASSGIGKEFACQLSDQYDLILVARRKDRLEKLASDLSCTCLVITADLSKEEECLRVYDEIKDKDIEVFINNAGFGECGSFRETDLNKELNMIDVNIKAVHIFTKLMLNYFDGKKGYILNVASIAGLTPGGPYMAGYYATKSYVTSLTRALVKELKDAKSQTYIGCLCPGPIDTEFNQVANVRFALKGMSANQCVSYALKKMKKKKTVIIPSLMLRAGMVLAHFIPTGLYIDFLSHQQKRKI